MKKSVSKRLKIALVAIVLIIAIISASLLFMTAKNPGIKANKITLLNYSNKASAKYNVLLKPNPLYDSASLGEDMLYMTSFVDKVKTNFQYEFIADKPTDIEGEYEVLAVVEGYTIEKEKVKTIWKKKFILLPKTIFKLRDTKALIAKEIIFSLDEYNLFVNQISEAAKINIPAKMSMVMNISMKATYGSQVIEKKFAPAIKVPLNTNYFDIVKSGIEEKTEVMEETKLITLPVNQKLVITYSVILGISVLALLYLIIFVKGDAHVDVLKKQLNKIFKVHGNRFVAINSEIGTSFDMNYQVKSIDDLVRIADELGKPILYKYSSNSKEITKFYIHDDKAMYSYNLLASLANNDVEVNFTGLTIAKDQSLT